MSTALDTAWMRAPSTRKPHRLAPCCREAIELDRTAETVRRAAENCPPADLEQERYVLGLALAGEAMPPWLGPEHFFALRHRTVYAAIQAVGGRLPDVARHLTDQVPALELAKLVDEAVWSVRMGWLGPDFERLRELWKARELLAACERVAVRLRGGETFEAGLAELRETVRSCK